MIEQTIVMNLLRTGPCSESRSLIGRVIPVLLFVPLLLVLLLVLLLLLLNVP